MELPETALNCSVVVLARLADAGFPAPPMLQAVEVIPRGPNPTFVAKAAVYRRLGLKQLPHRFM